MDKTLIFKLEKLTNLSLSEEERSALAEDLTQIMNMVNQLQEVNTEGVEPLTWLSDREQNLRHDQPIQGLPIDQALTNAPDTADRFFRIPKNRQAGNK